MPTRGTPLRDCQAPRWSRGQIAHSLGTLSFSGPSRHATTCSLLSPSRVKERLRPALGAAAGGGDAGIDLGAKSNPCHSRNSGGLDLRAARACRGRAAPRPPASPAPRGAGHSGGHPSRRRRTAPRTHCGPGRAAGGALRLPFHLPREGASGAGDAGAGGGGAPGQLRGEGTLRALRAHTTGSSALPVSVDSRWDLGAGRRAGVGPPSPGRK